MGLDLILIIFSNFQVKINLFGYEHQFSHKYWQNSTKMEHLYAKF